MLRPGNRSHWMAFSLALLVAHSAGAPAFAQAPAQPAAVLTVQSIDGALDSVRYLLTLAGREEQAKNIDGLLSGLTSGKNFQGIDTKKPNPASV